MDQTEKRRPGLPPGEARMHELYVELMDSPLQGVRELESSDHQREPEIPFRVMTLKEGDPRLEALHDLQELRERIRNTTAPSQLRRQS